MSIRLRRPPRPARSDLVGPGAPPLSATSGLSPAAPTAWLRLRASAGVVGPAAFTAAWVTASLLQTGYSATEVQISGLAAPDARYPWIMITGFVVMGGCCVVFGSALQEALGGTGRAGPAPRLIQVTGLLGIAAGLLRRDQMLLTASASESWHNHAHDLISIPVYVSLVAVPLLLARRLRDDPRFPGLRIPLVASALASAAVLAVFASPAIPSWDGVLQRVAVTLPFAATAAVGLCLATRGLATRGLATRGPTTRGLAARDLTTRRSSRLWWRHGCSEGDPAGSRAGGCDQQPGQGLLPADRAHKA